MKKKKKIYKCRVCKEKISKRKYDSDKICNKCDRTIYVNLKTGRRIVGMCYESGNPIYRAPNKEVWLKEGVYIVKGKYSKSFWFIGGGFAPDDIFEPKCDFTIKDLKKAIALLEREEK